MIADLVEKIRPRSMVDLMPPEVFAEAFSNGDDWAPVQYSYYWALARLFRPREIFEIGVLGGASMASMLMGAGPHAVGTGWDNEGYRKGSNALARKTWEICGVSGQARLQIIDSQQVASLRKGIDLIHVDGDHSFAGAMHDLELALAAEIPVILFDDIFNLNTDCRAAAEEFLKQHAKRVVHFEVLPTTTGLMVIKLAPP